MPKLDKPILNPSKTNKMKDIKSRKFTLVEKLISVSDEQIIQYLEQFFKKLEQEDEQKLPPLTPEEIAGVKQAMEQAKNGEVYSEEEVKKMFLK